MKTVEMYYFGIDSWNRPVFKVPGQNRFYGSTDKLVDYGTSNDVVMKNISSEDLVYFGNRFDCEPYGDPQPVDEDWVIITKEMAKVK